MDVAEDYSRQWMMWGELKQGRKGIGERKEKSYNDTQPFCYTK